MAKLSQEKINEIVRLYQEIGIYSQVAKLVGWSPTTVKKYCNATAAESVPKNIIHFSGEIKPVSELDLTIFLEKTIDLTTLSNEEYEELKGVWKEIWYILM